MELDTVTKSDKSLMYQIKQTRYCCRWIL